MGRWSQSDGGAEAEMRPKALSAVQCPAKEKLASRMGRDKGGKGARQPWQGLRKTEKGEGEHKGSHGNKGENGMFF